MGSVKSGEYGNEYHQPLTDIGRQGPGDELDEIVEHRPAFLDGRLDGREVVVGKHHVRRLFRHFGAAHAHGDADIGLLERGRIVDTIAGHCHHMPFGLQCLHQAQLLFG